MTKRQAVEQCIRIVSEEFNLEPERILTAFSAKQKNMLDARKVIWHHMRECGMEIHTIARLFKLSHVHIERSTHHYKLAMMEKDHALIAKLPRIETKPQ